MNKHYDQDFYGWTVEQADALKRRSLNEIDWPNLIEEVESLGRSEFSQLESRLEVLLAHLLKWMFQPAKRSRSWQSTISEQRRRVRRVLEENPSLAPKAQAAFENAYPSARVAAMNETGLDIEQFPERPAFTCEQALDDDFFPESASPRTKRK